MPNSPQGDLEGETGHLRRQAGKERVGQSEHCKGPGVGRGPWGWFACGGSRALGLWE